MKARVSSLLLCASLYVASIRAEEVDVDFTVVPSVVSEVTVDSNTELGPCVCDLHEGKCDPNCCCDGDCGTVSFDWCLPDGPREDDSVSTCIDTSTLSKVNARESDGLVTVESLVSDQLCVRINNNPSLGTYFSPVTDFTVGQAVAEAVPFPLSYGAPQGVVSSGGALDAGSPVYAFDAARARNIGELKRTAASADGSCAGIGHVRFLEDTGTHGCTVAARTAEGLAALCGGGSGTPTLSADVLALGTLYARSGAAASSAEEGSFVRAEVARVEFVSASSGATVRVVEGDEAAALVAPDAAALTTYEAATRTCRNAAVVSDVTLLHDGAGSIVAASASLVVTDVTLPASGSAAVSVNQRHAVTFAPNGVNPRETARSGNPGYHSGLPVLAGRLLNDPAGTGKQAIVRNTRGLTLPAAPWGPGGACTARDDSRPVARMGAPGTTSCSVTLTEDELRGLCTDPAEAPPAQLTLPYPWIGRFGNADPSLAGEWVEIEVDEWRPSPSWSSTGGRCDAFPAALHVEIVTTDYGSVLNPQRRIVGARARYSTENWQFDPMGPTSQRFTYTTTVTFAHLEDGALVEVMPAAPSAFFSVPKDTLYPFQLNAAARPGGTAWMVALVAVSISLAAALSS